MATNEGAGRALLIVTEEMGNQLDDDERVDLGNRLKQLLEHSQQASLRKRLGKALASLLRPMRHT